jgi:hypothetical protein
MSQTMFALKKLPATIPSASLTEKSTKETL